MESVQDIKAGRLADLQLPLLQFLILSTVSIGFFYVYHTIKFFDRIARSKRERNIQRVLIIMISLLTVASQISILKNDFHEFGFLLLVPMKFVWYALMIHAAKRLQSEWGYSMDLIWSILFGAFYLQHKANQGPDGNFQKMNKRLLFVCIVVAVWVQLAPQKTIKIQDSEMSPTLIEGDYLGVDRQADSSSIRPKLSDIVVFQDRESEYIGRVHAGPGQKVKVASSKEEATKERTLGMDEYYVLPDNMTIRTNLELGLEPYGIISSKQLVGRVGSVLWNVKDYNIRWDRLLLRIAP
ncbi:MAG: hypothetical protein EOP04_31910 [Proteobacteria bacterium]|nr:MAG: hypothetical protein EOP04_31910 [Pseudomonadota bacterium]